MPKTEDKRYWVEFTNPETHEVTPIFMETMFRNDIIKWAQVAAYEMSLLKRFAKCIHENLTFEDYTGYKVCPDCGWSEDICR